MHCSSKQPLPLDAAAIYHSSKARQCRSSQPGLPVLLCAQPCCGLAGALRCIVLPGGQPMLQQPPAVLFSCCNLLQVQKQSQEARK
jgi:hypothetical protein